MLPERKTGGYRIRPYDIINILYTNATAGSKPPPFCLSFPIIIVGEDIILPHKFL